MHAAGLELDGLARLDLEAGDLPHLGDAVFDDVVCTSKRAAGAAEPPIRRSDSVPLLVMVRYPAPTVAPFGVARAQGLPI